MTKSIAEQYAEEFRYRRFGYQFEFVENGMGTDEQRFQIRKSVRDRAPFGSPLDRVLWHNARSVKMTRRWVAILFDELDINGFAGGWSMVLDHGRVGSGLEYTFWHELGHIIDRRLFTYDHKDSFQSRYPNVAAGAWRQQDNYATTPNEQWARAFSRWVVTGNETEPIVADVLSDWTGSR